MAVIAIAKAVEQQAFRIEKLLEQSEARFRRAIRNNLSQIKDGRRFNRIERLIQRGEYETAINESAVIVAQTVNEEFVTTYTTGGFSAAEHVQGAIGLQVNFNQYSRNAVAELQRENLRLVRQFTQQQRQASLQAIQAGLQQGVNPRQQADNFRDSIGLTASQEERVRNYRRSLELNSRRSLQYELRDKRSDRSVLRALDSGERLEQDQIDRMVARYRNNSINHRAEVIARTESLRSLNMGLRQGFQQQIDNGNLDSSQLQRKWVTARDERVRDFSTGAQTSHRTMNGQIRDWNTPFESGAGAMLLHPGDPNAPGNETILCRCIATTRINPTREQEQQARSQAQAEPNRRQSRRARRQDFDANNFRINQNVDIDALEEFDGDIEFQVGDNSLEINRSIFEFGATEDGEEVWAMDLGFKVNGGYDMGSIQDPREGARVALRARRQFSETVKNLPDGMIVTNTPWSSDGAGESRARIYSKFGFGPVDELGTQYGVVSGGTLHPVNSEQVIQQMQAQGIEG